MSITMENETAVFPTTEQRIRFVFSNDESFAHGLALEIDGLFERPWSVAEAEEKIEQATDRVKTVLRAELDLMTCPVQTGDVVQIVKDGASGALVVRGEIRRVARVEAVGNQQTYHLVSVPEGKDMYMWAVLRSSFRAIPGGEFPARPVALPEEAYNWIKGEMLNAVASFRVECSGAGCDCSIVTGTVDHLSKRLVAKASSVTASESTAQAAIAFATTEEGKNWLGAVLRWARGEVVKRAMDEEPTPEPTPEPATDSTTLADRITTLEATIAEQRRTIESLRVELQGVRDTLAKAYVDADTISETFNEEAKSRGWCSEADEIITRLNRQLTVLTLTQREREVDVHVSGTATVNWTRVITVTVRGDEDLEDATRDQFDPDYVSMDDVDRYSLDNLEIDDVEEA